MSTPNTKRDENVSSNDLYITPKEAMDAIIPYVRKDIDKIHNIRRRKDAEDYAMFLDPCQGLGDIVAYFSEKFQDIYPVSNELYPCSDESKMIWLPNYQDDFLSDEGKLAETKSEYDLILCNPPYNKAMEFVLQGFNYAPIQWHFLRLSFLESQKRFEELFNLGKLSDVYIFTYRVSCPKGVNREKTANSVAYCWYRWDNYYCGQPKLHWLTKPNNKGE